MLTGAKTRQLTVLLPMDRDRLVRRRQWFGVYRLPYVLDAPLPSGGVHEEDSYPEAVDLDTRAWHTGVQVTLTATSASARFR